MCWCLECQMRRAVSNWVRKIVPGSRVRSYVANDHIGDKRLFWIHTFL